jgi:hypothetical protein
MTASLTETIKRAMEPLAQKFGLQTREECEDAMVAEVLYANETTAIRVTIDWAEFRPFVRLYQLERGQLPLTASVGLPAGEPLKDFDADDLLILRANRLSPVGKMFAERSPEGALPLLRAYAAALEQHAGDVLQGDFAIFPTLDAEVRKRYNTQRG